MQQTFIVLFKKGSKRCFADDMDDDWEEVHAAGYGHPGEEARSFPHTVANTLVSISNRARQYLGY